MNIRPGAATDAASLAALVRSFSDLLVFDAEAAVPFWESMSEAAHAANITSSRYSYLVAEQDGQVIGYLAMRDRTHLFNLFVAAASQRQGVARALWGRALTELGGTRGRPVVTVNASSNAIAVYHAIGFRQAGELVRQHGIEFMPMQFQAGGDAV